MITSNEDEEILLKSLEEDKKLKKEALKLADKLREEEAQKKLHDK